MPAVTKTRSVITTDTVVIELAEHERFDARCQYRNGTYRVEKIVYRKASDEEGSSSVTIRATGWVLRKDGSPSKVLHKAEYWGNSHNFPEPLREAIRQHAQI
jgi:hypothetical protein